MSGAKSGFRARLMRGIHAEGPKSKLDHDGLRDLARANYGVTSMAHMSDVQLLGMYKMLSGGRGLKRRGNLPNRGETPGADAELASGEDLVMLDNEFALGGFADAQKKAFIRRQLKGRDVIRTRGDLSRVMAGVRAINKRKNAT